MTNEEIVLSKRNGNKFLGFKPIKFSFSDDDVDAINLKNTKPVPERVRKIIYLCDVYDTEYSNGGFQCRNGANRSTVDIWRVYKYYFGDVEIFPIMRALYKLTVKKRLLGTNKCPNIRKRVFWRDNFIFAERDLYEAAELGVPLKDWEHIGLSKGK